jgi:hypothetical protein
MKLVMTLNTEDHGLSVSLHHLAFPGFFSLEVSPLSHMVYLHSPGLGSTPFASVGEEALSPFRSPRIPLRLWDEVGIAIRVFSLLQVSSGGDHFIGPGEFSLSFESHPIAVWPPFEATRYFLERTLALVCHCSQETACGHPKNVFCDQLHIISQCVLSQKPAYFCIVDHEYF